MTRCSSGPQRDGIDWRELADRETELFREDMAALRVLPPHDYVAATEAIEEVVEVVEKLLASGAAYVVDDPEYPDVYFRADATRSSATSPATTATRCGGCSPSAAATRIAPARATNWTR